MVMRHYQGESDLQRLVDLFDACESVDKVEFQISIERLRLGLEHPSIDRDRDLMLCQDWSRFGKCLQCRKAI
jgi:hypothetical protein